MNKDELNSFLEKRKCFKVIELYENLVDELLSYDRLTCSISCSISKTSPSINLYNTKYNHNVYFNFVNQDKNTFIFLGLLNEDLEARYYDLTINISMNWIEQSKQTFNNLIYVIINAKITESDLLDLGFEEHQFSKTKKSKYDKS